MDKIKTTFSLIVFLLGLIVALGSCNKDDNNDPTVEEVLVNPQTVATNAAATVTVTASDPDGDALIYSYAVDGGSVSGNGATADWIAPNNPGEYSISVSVNDGNGGTATGFGYLTVIQGK